MGTEERPRFGGRSEDRGTRIKKRREELGLTQYAFAKDRGLNLNTLRRWEEGYAFQNAEMARRLATALDWTLDELLGDDPAARVALAEAERSTVTASADARLSRVEDQVRDLAKQIRELRGDVRALSGLVGELLIELQAPGAPEEGGAHESKTGARGGEGPATGNL